MSYSRYGLGAMRAGVSTSASRPVVRAAPIRPMKPLTSAPVVRTQIAKAARQQALTVRRTPARPMAAARAPRVVATSPSQPFLRAQVAPLKTASAVLQFNPPGQTSKGAPVYSGGGGGGGGGGGLFTRDDADFGTAEFGADEVPAEGGMLPLNVASQALKGSAIRPRSMTVIPMGGSNKTKILIIGGVAVAGAAAYYFLVHKKRKAPAAP